MTTLTPLFVGCITLFNILAVALPDRGLVENPQGDNRALIVGVAKNLPGIDIDVRNVTKMAIHPDYKFSPSILENAQGTTKNIAQSLTNLGYAAADDGTLMFYFSGHGNRGLIQVQDRTMRVGEIRTAIEKGREGLGNLRRLILIFDSCFSGSLLDPFRGFIRWLFTDVRTESELFADEVAQDFESTARNNRLEKYWDSLFVFAACRANETSLASSKGSIFTNAMIKAFNESMSSNLTMKEFVAKTQAYTQGHHPVARFAPGDLENEKMRP